MIRILYAIAALAAMSPTLASAAPVDAGAFDSGALASARNVSDDENEVEGSNGASPAPLPLAGIPALIALAGGAGAIKLRRRRA